MGRGRVRGKKMQHQPPSQVMVDYARRLRSNLTPAERLVWNALRNRQFHNLKFVRQFIIGPYIVDFCCRSKKIVIEIDGGTHSDQRKSDQVRSDFIRSKGYRIIRFTNDHVADEPNEFVCALERTVGLKPDESELWNKSLIE